MSDHTSLPVRGAWIEILRNSFACLYALSLPVRGAWIEMWGVCCMPHRSISRSP